MGDTKIEWADFSWNPISGCTPVSEGCTNCYARRMAQRLRGRYGYPQDEPFRVTLHPERLEEPLHWKKPKVVFLCSMSDFFHPHVPVAFQGQVLRTIARCPQHQFLILTKSPGQAALFQYVCGGLDAPNIWLGVTAENQARADERIPLLLQIPAAHRFVSLEPLLGPISLAGLLADHSWQHGVPGGINWVIAGCESGPGARPMDEEWVRSIHDQCVAAHVPLFYKQKMEGGKKISLPYLDGQQWAQCPEGLQVGS